MLLYRLGWSVVINVSPNTNARTLISNSTPMRLQRERGQRNRHRRHSQPMRIAKPTLPPPPSIPPPVLLLRPPRQRHPHRPRPLRRVSLSVPIGYAPFRIARKSCTLTKV